MNLAKLLHQYLNAADVHNSTLRALGWFDFLNGPPDSDDARIVAARAVHHLIIDESGRQIWHDDSVLYAILAFTQAARGGRQPTAVIDKLSKVLEASPVTLTSLEAWFLSEYE